MENMFAPIIFSILISLVIAYFLGRNRQIGFGWSFFFNIFMTPIVGFIMTMLSPKFYKKDLQPSKAKKSWGMILLIWFIITTILQLVMFVSGHGNALTISLSIGFAGLGYYLIELSKGKSFNRNLQNDPNQNSTENIDPLFDHKESNKSNDIYFKDENTQQSAPQEQTMQKSIPKNPNFRSSQKSNERTFVVILVILFIIVIGLIIYFQKNPSNSNNGSAVVNTAQENNNLSTNRSSNVTSDNHQTNTDEKYTNGYYVVNGTAGRKVYFHNLPNKSTIRTAYFDTKEKVYVQKIENNFGYVEFVNLKGQASYGWLEMKYLIKLPSVSSNSSTKVIDTAYYYQIDKLSVYSEHVIFIESEKVTGTILKMDDLFSLKIEYNKNSAGRYFIDKFHKNGVSTRYYISKSITVDDSIDATLYIEINPIEHTILQRFDQAGFFIYHYEALNIGRG